jgi:hypothetical protein
MPLSALLKESDMDMGAGGVMGWWFYLNFTASSAAYTD